MASHQGGGGLESPRPALHRSLTELAAPHKLHRHPHPTSTSGGGSGGHSSYHHHHPHRHHHSKHERQSDDRLVPQSAHPSLQVGRGSLDLPRPEFYTPDMTPNQSRRGSVMIPGSGDEARTGPVGAAVGGLLAGAQPQGRKVSKEEEERKREQEETEKAVSRAAGLKQSLMDLSTFSTSTTRRLDNTYYAVLEKMSVLRNTVLAMKELAVLSQTTSATFEQSEQELATDIQNQLRSIGTFAAQEERIQSLHDRVQEGRTRIHALGERVDVVRERIEGWERADREWQERTRKRLKVIWIIMSMVFFALLLLFLSAQYAEPLLESAGMDITPANASVSVSVPMLVATQQLETAPAVPSPDKVDIVGGTNGSIPRALTDKEECPKEERVHVPSLLRDRAPEDERLRLFDEL